VSGTAENLPPVAILAGGLATRMRPQTETIAKAMLEVAGEPFIAHQLRVLAREGVSKVVLCLGYLGRQVEDFVGDGRDFGLSVIPCYDGPDLLGTGGALRRAVPLLGEVFFVLYGDSYLDVPMAEVWQCFRQARRPALMTVYRNEGKWDTSNVVYDGDRIAYYSKKDRRPEMEYIDFGLGLISAELLQGWPVGQSEGQSFDLADLYSNLAASGRLAGWESPRRFYEIGTPAGLAETDRHLRASR
jgi:NDP-sugar pyrophosphorylase family protein